MKGNCTARYLPSLTWCSLYSTMFRYCLFLILALTPAWSRHVPRFADLDREDQQLFRAAYDTPTYDHDEYQEEDLEPGKLDLLKDGLWAIKAKIKELKAFNKALAANMLSTKLKLKELLVYHLEGLKKKPHIELVEKKKPVYHSYSQPPAYQAHYEHHEAPYEPHAPPYEPHAPSYEPHAPSYEPHAPSYEQHAPSYEQHAAPAPAYQSYQHDPYH